MSCYAVRKGKVPGIYNTWNECKELVIGFPNAEFKKFETVKEARNYIKNEKPIKDNKKPENQLTNYAFIDGSYNEDTGVYGYGGILVNEYVEHKFQGNGRDPEYSKLRNVAGELCGALAVIKMALGLNMKKLTIYYDYEGIGKWATGEWKAKNKITQGYRDYIKQVKDKLELHFVHVRGHSGIEENEIADRLAKDAVKIHYDE